MINFVYTSSGQKLRAVYYTAMPNIRVGMGMEYDPGLKMNIPVFIWGKNNLKLEYQMEIVERQALKNYDEKKH